MSADATFAAAVAELSFEAVVFGEPLEQDDRVAVRRAVPEAEDRQASYCLVVVGAPQGVQLRTDGVHRSGTVPREELERDQRRSAAGGTLVAEPAAEQLDLLPEAELADCAVRDRPLAVVGASGSTFDLVFPLPAQVGKLSLLPLRGEVGGSSGCLGERQEGAWPPFSERGAGPT